MVVRSNWHRYGTKLRHCHPVYTTVFGRHVDYMLLQYTIYSARPVAAQQQARRALCSAAVAYFFNDFYQTNYLKIYRTCLRQIFRVGRTAL